MKIIFLTISNIDNLNSSGIYTDLMRCFQKNGHNIYVVCPTERRYKKPTQLVLDNGVNILKVRIGNIQKCNIIEKGISTLLIKRCYTKAINKYFNDVQFDLVLYSTPPITFSNVIKYIKKRDTAKSYLLLKDIFPQNAVDLNMFSSKSVIYRYFRRKETELYNISDKIGCMSQANVDYILKHNPEITLDKIHVNPNSIEVRDIAYSEEDKQEIRMKYGLPIDKIIFVYGGNLGKPQGIPYIIDCLKSQRDNDKVFFLIVGSGTEYGKLESYLNEEHPNNVKLMSYISKEDYDILIASCDIGLIFLDYRFTIPNFPSRLLGYMQAGIPVLACTDPNTDIGKVIVGGGFGWWCESNDVDGFVSIVHKISDENIVQPIRYNAIRYLKSEYSVSFTVGKILNWDFDGGFDYEL